MGKGTLKFLIGNYIDWQEEHTDGIAGKDWGTGIVIEAKMHSPSYVDDYFMYKVYRNKHKDLYWFEERQLTLKEKL